MTIKDVRRMPFCWHPLKTRVTKFKVSAPKLLSPVTLILSLSALAHHAVANGDGDFCLTQDSATTGRVTHTDKPFRANYHYLCLNGSCQNAQLVNGAWEYLFNNLVLGTDYQIKTQIDDSSGECGVEATVTFQEGGACISSSCLPKDTQAPSTPSSLSGQGKNGKSVTLTWEASSDDRAVATYKVQRNGQNIGESATSRFIDTGLNENTNYRYRVQACDAADNCSAYSESITVNSGVFVPDTNAPSVPGQPTLTTATLSTITFTWAASSDADGVVSLYRVYRNSSSIAEVTETQYEDTGLAPSTNFTYSVQACDDSGNCSNLSQGATLSTEAPDFGHLDWTSNSFITGKGAGPEPRNNTPEALRTPINGLSPTTYGFAFDINGNQLTWRWGPSLVKQAGDSGLEMHCSDNNNATFKKVAVQNGKAQIPCNGTYTYFFRYLHPHSLNNNPAHQWIWTGLFTTAGSRINPYAEGAYSFTDGSANWARIRHPITTDGITAAVLDRPNGGERLRNLDRYLIWVNDDSGYVDFNMDVSFMSKSDPRVPQDVVPGFRRNEAHRNASGGPNGQQFFAVNTAAPFGDAYRTAPQEALEGFGNLFSYGQVISFEFSVEAAGQTPAQTYNDFSHYIVGCGFCGKYGDPRLNPAGKASTSQVFADSGAYTDLEKNAIFTQPLTTIYTEKMVDDFLVGHHLFHGIDPNIEAINDPKRNLFDNPDARIGEKSCGGCHFRDGRGSEVVPTPSGPRLPLPTYGVKLLEVMEGRDAGFGWEGTQETVHDQIRAALKNDHKVNPDHLPSPVLNLLDAYVEMLTVPARDPGAYDREGVAEGDQLFNDIGCADCHTPVARTRADAPVHLRNLTIRPYTDMKLHSMNGGSFRTPPLWGLGHNLELLERNGNRAELYLHDGSATSVHAAIEKHDASGASSRTAYRQLSQQQKASVVAFVKSL